NADVACRRRSPCSATAVRTSALRVPVVFVGESDLEHREEARRLRRSQLLPHRLSTHTSVLLPAPRTGGLVDGVGCRTTSSLAATKGGVRKGTTTPVQPPAAGFVWTSPVAILSLGVGR